MYHEAVKKVILILVALLWCNVGFAGCIKGDCTNGYGTYTYANGEKYVGEFIDDRQNGQGTYTHPNGEKYVGKYKDGKQHGQGTLTFADGTVYKSIFEKNKLIEKQ